MTNLVKYCLKIKNLHFHITCKLLLYTNTNTPDQTFKWTSNQTFNQASIQAFNTAFNSKPSTKPSTKHSTKPSTKPISSNFERTWHSAPYYTMASWKYTSDLNFCSTLLPMIMQARASNWILHSWDSHYRSAQSLYKMILARGSHWVYYYLGPTEPGWSKGALQFFGQLIINTFYPNPIPLWWCWGSDWTTTMYISTLPNFWILCWSWLHIHTRRKCKTWVHNFTLSTIYIPFLLRFIEKVHFTLEISIRKYVISK